MQIEGQFPVLAPPRLLMRHLFDARLMASCLPGCETLEPLADDRYRAVVVIAMAGIKARFDLRVEVTRKDEHDVWATTRGEEGGQASTLQADSQVHLEPDGDGTRVSYRSEVTVTGRLGRFALGMMKKKAQSLGDEFAANLQAELQRLAGAETACDRSVELSAERPAADPPSERSAGHTVGPTETARTAGLSDATLAAPGVATGPDASAPIPAVTSQRTWWQRLLAWLRGEREAAVVRREQ